ncbi:MAG: hypothetical protein H7124_17960 [Phycisphaerales bacterium]|nr:hypothetical protein [Hyphomonadaceae bacterium]
MTKLDNAIRQALSAEDAEFLARFEQDGVFNEALGTFRGRSGALNVFAAIITFAMFGGFLYCTWNAFEAAALRETVLWSSGAVVAMLAVAMLKMYFWMEMNRNATLREVKRLELQVARFAASRTAP